MLRGARGFRKERGAVIVEFGLVFLVMMMVVFATIDFSRAFFILNNLTSAVREGARYGAVLTAPDSATGKSQIKAVVRRFTYPFGSDSLTDSLITVNTDSVRTNGKVTVIVNYTFTTITPLANLAGLDTIPMREVATFRWERTN
jgi:Flp pilus assembly protein TadG